MSPEAPDGLVPVQRGPEGAPSSRTWRVRPGAHRAIDPGVSGGEERREQPSEREGAPTGPGPSFPEAHARPGAASPASCSEPASLESVGPGLQLFGFRLLRPLGAGAFARVFLAEQADLALRPVVLKVSAIEGTEPQTLAQLQHTHIVPIYSLHQDWALGLRAICMPYFGGASLSQVLDVIWAGGQRPMRGRELVEALAAIEVHPAGPDRTAEVSGTPTRGERPTPSPGSLGWLCHIDYVSAVLWIVARLAEGLQHAHERGVLHRDIKPSNILLASDGQPLLLDFNVSHGGSEDGLTAPLGGTVTYAAPEHLQALLHPDPDHVACVDRRSDIYAMGIVLYEMLTGDRPFRMAASYSVLPEALQEMAEERARVVPSGRQRHPGLAWSVESVLRKCLAPSPLDRYQQASHLAEDLQRILEDLPLRHAPELSWVERGQKWVRRHPRWAATGALALVLTGLCSAGWVGLQTIQQHLARTEAALESAQARERKRAFEAEALRALCLVNTVDDLQSHWPEGHAACRVALGHYHVLTDTEWQQRAEWRAHTVEERKSLAAQVRELLQLYAWGHVRQSGEQEQAIAEALGWLSRAEAIAELPPSPALWLDRASYLERLGRGEEAEQLRWQAGALTPTLAQDHYQLALSSARRGTREDLKKAISHLDQALDRAPRHYWALIQRGLCHLELGQSDLALADFSMSVGVWPELAWGYFNRGCLLARAGRRVEAIRDFSAALERDPGLVAAIYNRGLMYLETKQHAQALRDLDEVAGRGRVDALVLGSRGIALEGLGRTTEADAAFDAAFARLSDISSAHRQRLHLARGFAVAARRPEQAAADFAAILAEAPRHPQARYGLAMLAVARGTLDEALTHADCAVQADPTFVDARRCRAIIHARRGAFAAASEDINTCLQSEPNSGMTLYAAACVAALASAALGDDSAGDQAMGFLRQALNAGYGHPQLKFDPDLSSLRKRPAFQQWVAGGPGDLP